MSLVQIYCTLLSSNILHAITHKNYQGQLGVFTLFYESKWCEKQTYHTAMLPEED